MGQANNRTKDVHWIHTDQAQLFFGGVIVANSIYMGCETDYKVEEESGPSSFWFVAESCFLVLFSVELVLRLRLRLLS